MTLDTAAELMRSSLIMVLTISGPMLLIGMVVGVVIAIAQAVTQVQEQTLTFVPKITAMFGAAIVLAPWILNMLLEFTRQLFSSIAP